MSDGTRTVGSGVAAGELTQELIGGMEERFSERPVNRALQNAVTQTSVEEVSLNRRVVAATDHTFSNLLDDWSATHQRATGRCWLFAGLNLLRVGAMKKMNVKDFEFSQNYLFYWHKLERANFFFEAIIQTREREVDDRTVAYLLDHPVDDAGQWTMFANLVERHGLVPKAFMPETQSSSSSRSMTRHLNMLLRRGAAELRGLSRRSEGASLEELRTRKEAFLDDVHRILRFHLGDPPSSFVWQWNDKEGVFHRDEEATPQEFARRYVSAELSDYVCFVSDARATSRYGQTYTIDYLGNVVGGRRVVYLNTPIDTIRDLAMRTILDGEPVWFGCDMGQMTGRSLGIMDPGLYELDQLYGTELALDRGRRLEYHQSQMSHAMLFTGVDVLEERPRRWRVENSWGEDAGRKGFFVMSDDWFSEYVLEAAIHKRYLTPEMRDALETEPEVLPPWDPMGALARD